MKFGLLYEMETPRPWHALSEYNVYWEALAQIETTRQVERQTFVPNLPLGAH